MKKWFEVRVELVHGRGVDLEQPPGRIFLVGPKHTFGELAEAIDQGFARWDLGHLHVFRLTDGREIGPADDDLDTEFEDEADVVIASTIGKGDEFRYVFDFGDDWTHICAVRRDDIDPATEFLDPPDAIVPVFGWGTIPDQYGRTTDAEDDER